MKWMDGRVDFSTGCDEEWESAQWWNDFVVDIVEILDTKTIVEKIKWIDDFPAISIFGWLSCNCIIRN